MDVSAMLVGGSCRGFDSGSCSFFFNANIWGALKYSPFKYSVASSGARMNI